MKNVMFALCLLALIAGLLVVSNGAAMAAEEEGLKGAEDTAKDLFSKLSKALAEQDGKKFVELIAPSTWEEMLMIYNMESMYSCGSCDDQQEATVDTIKQMAIEHISKNPLPLTLNLDEAKKLSADRVMLKLSITFSEECGLSEAMPCVLYAVNENGKWGLSAGVSAMILGYMPVGYSTDCEAVAECVEVPAPAPVEEENSDE